MWLRQVVKRASPCCFHVCNKFEILVHISRNLVRQSVEISFSSTMERKSTHSSKHTGFFNGSSRFHKTNDNSLQTHLEWVKRKFYWAQLRFSIGLYNRKQNVSKLPLNKSKNRIVLCAAIKRWANMCVYALLCHLVDIFEAPCIIF